MVLPSAMASAFFRFSNHCLRDGSLCVGEGLVMCCTGNGRADLGHRSDEPAVFFFNVNILYCVYRHIQTFLKKGKYAVYLSDDF
jgi:hypothetical protein